MCDLNMRCCNQRGCREDEMLAQQPETFQPSQMFLDCRVSQEHVLFTSALLKADVTGPPTPEYIK